jgi:hypothetical protein
MDASLFDLLQQLLACGYQYRPHETAVAEALVDRDGKFETQHVIEDGTFLTKFNYRFQKGTNNYWIKINFRYVTLGKGEDKKEALRLVLCSYGKVEETVGLTAANQKRFYPDLPTTWSAEEIKQEVRDWLSDWEDYVVRSLAKFYKDRAKINSTLKGMNFLVVHAK